MESQSLLEEAHSLSEALHLGDSADVRSLELWAESRYNMALLQFDRKNYELAEKMTQELIAHVQSEHGQGLQNNRTVALLTAAIELQRISAGRR